MAPVPGNSAGPEEELPFCQIPYEKSGLIRAETHRLIRFEKPEGSSRVVPAKPLILDLSHIVGPDDGSGVDIRRIINPFVVWSLRRSIANKDYVMPRPPLQQDLLRALLLRVLCLHLIRGSVRRNSLCLGCNHHHQDRNRHRSHQETADLLSVVLPLPEVPHRLSG